MTDKEIIFDIINEYVNGVDTYHNNGSMWFIFTDDRKWVIELTKEGTLWYNFYFFQDCFKYLSLDVVENQHYITEWVEDTIQNGVRYTESWENRLLKVVEDTIQNGIKLTEDSLLERIFFVEDTIENGIKETNWRKIDNHPTYVDHVINSSHHETKQTLVV